MYGEEKIQTLQVELETNKKVEYNHCKFQMRKKEEMHEKWYSGHQDGSLIMCL